LIDELRDKAGLEEHRRAERVGPHVPDRDLEKQADRADNAVGIEKPRGFQRGVFL